MTKLESEVNTLTKQNTLTTRLFIRSNITESHYRTIGKGTIGLSELSEYYRILLSDYRTGAQRAEHGAELFSFTPLSKGHEHTFLDIAAVRQVLSVKC